MGTEGAEFERAILFAIINFLAAASTPAIHKYVWPIFLYSFSGYLSLMIGLTILMILRGNAPSDFARLRSSVKKSFTLSRQRHLYALTYSAAVLCCFAIVESIHLDHGYWAVATTALIMKPDINQSLYRGLQRFIGTLIGVFIAQFIITYLHIPWILLLIIMTISFVTPWALLRNYLLASISISVLILLLIDIPNAQKGDLHAPMLRLKATAIGCGITMIGVFITQFIKRLAK
jgi:uncharacterized membrane protein YccC